MIEVVSGAVMCLALNIYFEARNQPVEGQIAVAQVVLTRVKDRRYPDTICGVIRQGPTKPSWHDKSVQIPVRHKCQFSWYCDGVSDVPKEADAFRWAKVIAYAVIAGKTTDLTLGANHYHSTKVKPRWADNSKLTTKIGQHIFYRF